MPPVTRMVVYTGFLDSAGMPDQCLLTKTQIFSYIMLKIAFHWIEETFLHN